MKIPAREKFFRLFSGMAGRATDTVAAGVSYVIHYLSVHVDRHRPRQRREHWRDILDPFGDQMGERQSPVMTISHKCRAISLDSLLDLGDIPAIRLESERIFLVF